MKQDLLFALEDLNFALTPPATAENVRSALKRVVQELIKYFNRELEHTGGVKGVILLPPKEKPGEA